MKKIVAFSIVGLICGYILNLHITQMRLKAKADEYRSIIKVLQNKNELLKKKKERLIKPDYDTVREEALKLGLIKKEEKVIRFYKPQNFKEPKSKN